MFILVWSLEFGVWSSRLRAFKLQTPNSKLFSIFLENKKAGGRLGNYDFEIPVSAVPRITPTYRLAARA
jgi:hypothetical protein